MFDFEALGWYGGPDPSPETRYPSVLSQGCDPITMTLDERLNPA